MEQPRLNLKSVTGVIVDREDFSRLLVGGMLRGFGISNLLVSGTGEEARQLIQANNPDICFVEGDLPDMTTAEFVCWIRRQPSHAVRFMPVIVLSGYTQIRLITAARDGGANIVVRKPIAPKTLFDRINWVARVSRAFIETSTYVGPDRRFHDLEPPDSQWKRATDVQREQLTKLEA